MHAPRWLSLIVTLTLSLTVYTAPAPSWNHGKLHRVPTDAHLDGVTALRKAFNKHGWKLSPGFIDRFERPKPVETNEKIAIPASNGLAAQPAHPKGTGAGKVSTFLANSNSEYLCPVTVGGQTLHMNLDTGSSDLWMFSTALESHERGAHALYNPARSASHHAIPHASFKVAYGDETSLEGHVAADTVAIGGVTVSAQTLAMPTSFSTGVIDDPSDGIVGLAFQKMNSICSAGTSAPASGSSTSCPDGYGPNPRPTWFENARSALRQGIFTVNFKAGTPGYFNFGSIDSTAFKGREPHYIPVDSSKGYWQFKSKSYKVGKAGKLVGYEGADGIADSGTSLLMLQPEVVAAYYQGVKGMKRDETGYTFPCGVELPDFEVAMGDYMAFIPGKVVNYAPVEDSDNMCYGGIQSNDGQAPQIFGDIMFKAIFVIFDYDNMRLGLAPHA